MSGPKTPCDAGISMCTPVICLDTDRFKHRLMALSRTLLSILRSCSIDPQPYIRACSLNCRAGFKRCGQSAGGDNDGCSNSTLKGDYAFTTSGQTFNPDGSSTVLNGVAITNFDCKTDSQARGGLTQASISAAPGRARPPARSRRVSAAQARPRVTSTKRLVLRRKPSKVLSRTARRT